MEASAAAAGTPLSRDTFWRYLNGRHGTPDEETLRALHNVFPKLTIRQLREASGLPGEDLGPWEPPRGSERLTRRQREVLTELVRLMIAPGAADAGDDPPSTAPTVLSERRAKRKPSTRRTAAYSPGDNPEAP
jgi:hypothetical protein